MGYLVEDLLRAGHDVVGVDNFSKYGEITRSYDDSSHYRFVCGDAKDAELMKQVLADCDVLIGGAAKIGGISYFHQYAYDLLAENERIMAAAFDAAIWAHRAAHLQRVVVVSSSMVFESATTFPTPEGAQLISPPPVSIRVRISSRSSWPLAIPLPTRTARWCSAAAPSALPRSTPPQPLTAPSLPNIKA